MLLTLTTRICEPDILVIELTGRITLGREVSHVEDTVMKAVEEGSRKIVMDIAGVHHIDSAGLGMIAFSFGKVTKEGGRFFLAGATGNVLDVFLTTHLDSVIPLLPSVDAACAAAKQAA
jgi:anti-sigma B factor antagonist